MSFEKLLPNLCDLHYARYVLPVLRTLLLSIELLQNMLWLCELKFARRNRLWSISLGIIKYKRYRLFTRLSRATA